MHVTELLRYLGLPEDYVSDRCGGSSSPFGMTDLLHSEQNHQLNVTDEVQLDSLTSPLNLDEAKILKLIPDDTFEKKPASGRYSDKRFYTEGGRIHAQPRARIFRIPTSVEPRASNIEFIPPQEVLNYLFDPLKLYKPIVSREIGDVKRLALSPVVPKRGDILHFEAAGYYRNDGLFIFDTPTSFIPLEGDIDEYGALPNQFTLAEVDHNPYYWSYIGHNRIIHVGATRQFSTRGGEAFMLVDGVEFKLEWAELSDHGEENTIPEELIAIAQFKTYFDWEYDSGGDERCDRVLLVY